MDVAFEVVEIAVIMGLLAMVLLIKTIVAVGLKSPLSMPLPTFAIAVEPNNAPEVGIILTESDAVTPRADNEALTQNISWQPYGRVGVAAELAVTAVRMVLLAMVLLIEGVVAVGLEPPLLLLPPMFAVVEPNNESEGIILAESDAATLRADNEALTQIISLQPYGRVDGAIEVLLLNIKVVAVGLEPPLSIPPPMFVKVEPNSESEVGITLTESDAAAFSADNEALTQTIS